MSILSKLKKIVLKVLTKIKCKSTCVIANDSHDVINVYESPPAPLRTIQEEKVSKVLGEVIELDI